MRTTQAIAASLLTLLTLVAHAACGADGGSGGDPATAPLTPARTAVGEPSGERVTATIGPAGGSLASADGALLVEVPAGAVAEAVAFGIQPIANHAPGAIAPTAWRLLPEGVEFAAPIRLTFRPTGEELAGTAPSLLRVVRQDEDRHWRLHEAVEIDEEAGTIRADVDHFSDWSLVAGALLSPRSAKVRVDESLQISVVFCEVLSGEDLLAPLVATCRSSEFFPRVVRGWSVNGAEGGSAATGTVIQQEDGSAIYTAPASIPSSNPVAVSARYRNVTDGHQVLLVSNVLVEEAACGEDPLRLCKYDLVALDGQPLPFRDLPRAPWENEEEVTRGQLTLDDYDGDGDGTWAIRYTWIEKRAHDELEHTVQFAGDFEPKEGGGTRFVSLDGTTFQGTIEASSVTVHGFPFSTSNATMNASLQFER